MTTDTDKGIDTNGDGTGDIFATTGDNPVIHSPAITPIAAANVPELPGRIPVVVVNISLAREPYGERCIKVGNLILTAAEAHRLALDLTEAADQAGESRRKKGFET